MKTLFLIFVLTFSMTILNGQNLDSLKQISKIYNKELGINIIYISNLKKPGLNDEYEWTPDPHYANGIQFKQHFKRYNLRSKFEFDFTKFSNNIYYWFGQGTDQGSYKFYSLSIGIEKRFCKKYIQPYLALDFLFDCKKITGLSYFAGGDLYYMKGFNYYNIKNYDFGLGPVFGIMFKPQKHISFTIETYLAVTKTLLTINETYYDITDSSKTIISGRTNFGWTRFKYLTKPITFSIFYNFN